MEVKYFTNPPRYVIFTDTTVPKKPNNFFLNGLDQYEKESTKKKYHNLIKQTLPRPHFIPKSLHNCHEEKCDICSLTRAENVGNPQDRYMVSKYDEMSFAIGNLTCGKFKYANITNPCSKPEKEVVSVKQGRLHAAKGSEQQEAGKRGKRKSEDGHHHVIFKYQKGDLRKQNFRSLFNISNTPKPMDCCPPEKSKPPARKARKKHSVKPSEIPHPVGEDLPRNSSMVFTNFNGTPYIDAEHPVSFVNLRQVKPARNFISKTFPFKQESAEDSVKQAAVCGPNDVNISGSKCSPRARTFDVTVYGSSEATKRKKHVLSNVFPDPP